MHQNGMKMKMKIHIKQWLPHTHTLGPDGTQNMKNDTPLLRRFLVVEKIALIPPPAICLAALLALPRPARHSPARRLEHFNKIAYECNVVSAAEAIVVYSMENYILRLPLLIRKLKIPTVALITGAEQ